MTIFRNELFTLPDGCVYTLVADADEGRLAHVIEKYGGKAFPVIKSVAWLNANAVKLNATDSNRGLLTARQFASPVSIKKAEQRWEQIKDIVDNRNLYEEGARWSLIKSHAEAVKCSPNTLLTSLRLYWQGGQTEDALLGYQSKPKAHLEYDKDAHEAPKVSTQRCRRGRPAVKPGSVNFHANAIDHQNFRDIIETFYLKDIRKSMAEALQVLREKYYSYRDGNGALYLKPAGEHPTLRQFSSYLRKQYTLESQLRRRKGDKAFERDHRPVLGTVEDVCLGVGFISEMDATIVDVTLVSSLNRADIIGRPTLYIIVDRTSRLVIGWYVGLENPCWAAALHAIFSVGEDKEALCHRLRIPYDSSDWPAQGILGQHIYVDRGESMSREAVKLGTGTATTVTNLPSCRPDWKPIVESRFKLTHQAIVNVTPGVNPSANAIQRRSEDFSLEAALTLEEFESILVKMFITYNRTVMKRYALSREQIADRVEPSPVNIYRHGLKTRAGQLPRYSESALRLALLPSTESTVDENGIWANDMCYQPETVNRQSWFIEGRKAVGAAKVSYDRRRIDKVYVHDRTEPDGYFIAVLARHSKKYAGMSLAEAALVMKLEDTLHGSAEQSKAQGRADFKEHAKPIVERAQKITAAAKKGVAKTALRENAKAAREAERDIERNAVAIPSTTVPVEAGPAEVFSDVDADEGNVRYLPSRTTEKPSALSLARKARHDMFEGTMPL